MRTVLQSRGTNLVFDGQGDASHFSIAIDVRPAATVRSEGSGEMVGPRPMELMAMALGACLADNVMVILKKKRLAFDAVRVEIEADRAPEPPRRFTGLRLRCVVRSRQVSQEVLDKVLPLAAKYCSAHATLSHGVPIEETAVVEVEGTA